jgi:aspartate-semialdehyde dehydrogenase
MRVAVLGATGLVGREMVRVLEQRRFPFTDLRLLASERSEGNVVEVAGEEIRVLRTEPQAFEGVDLVIASAGKGASKEWLPKAVEAGAVCVDNSSAFRMDDDVPLVVPEVNGEAARDHKGIIANPNCSTIQMVMALEPLRQAAGLKSVTVATYQSVSGKGKDAVDELASQTRGVLAGVPAEPKAFPHQIAFNCLPEIDAPGEHGYTGEEWKMIRETRKIMGLPELLVSATCVRVPVFFGHAEAVWAELDREMSVDEAKAAIDAFPNVRVVDDLAEHIYPITSAMGEDLIDTLVGRIRPSLMGGPGLAFWVVTDNIRKGAALNTVQIAEWLIEHGLLGEGV